MSKPHRKSFRARDLCKVADAESFKIEGEPPLGLGDIVTINSGGPNMLVVDTDGDRLTVAWRTPSNIEEMRLHRDCVHRIRDLW